MLLVRHELFKPFCKADGWHALFYVIHRVAFFESRGMKMVRYVSIKYILAIFLAICFVVLSAAPEGFAHRRPYRHHHSKTKGALVGGAVGAVGGALVGGG